MSYRKASWVIGSMICCPCGNKSSR
jgi:hypothetical protein